MKYLWQLPQNILAMLIYFIYKKSLPQVRIYKDSVIYYIVGFPGGLSLGHYIFLQYDCDMNMVNHEYGHTLQSKMLGWLYLPIVSLPSFIMAGLTNLHILKIENYYKHFPENWADKLGGVKR
jgi:hypothetical protein